MNIIATEKEEIQITYSLYFKNTKTKQYELCEERKTEKSIESLLYKIRFYSEQHSSIRPTWYGRIVNPMFDINDYKVKQIKKKIVETILEERWIK